MVAFHLEQKQNITTLFLYIFVAFKEGVFLLKKLTKIVLKSVKARIIGVECKV